MIELIGLGASVVLLIAAVLDHFSMKRVLREVERRYDRG